VKKTLLIATALVTWALSPSAAQDISISTILQSLPAEVQKNIEDIRAGCRAYWNDRGIADSSDALRFLVSSGGEGLIPFTLSGAQAIMVSDQALCGGQCLKGVTCTTVGSYGLNIYVRTDHAWSNALSTMVGGPVFLSTDKGDYTKFKALVLSISGADEKHCKVKWWKQYCDIVVKWDGKKFTYKPL
jgi:hypothetical protein